MPRFAAILLGSLLSFTSASSLAESSNQVKITTDGNFRYIISNGIPPVHGSFPNSGNPNSISAQAYNFKMPIHPQLNASATPLQGYMDFGVAIDGVPFDPGTAEFWQNDPNWRYEALSGQINLGMDQNNAHVQPNGAYHYHGLPTYLVSTLSNTHHSKIIGYAADGFPIYALYGYVDPNNPNSGIKELHSSYQLKYGTRPGGPGGTYDGTFTQDYVYNAGVGDLDECNGRFSVTPDYPEGTYTYFITAEFPLIPRCFKGSPDQSFNKQNMSGGNMRPGMGGQQGGQGQPGQRPPPPGGGRGFGNQGGQAPGPNQPR